LRRVPSAVVVTAALVFMAIAASAAPASAQEDVGTESVEPSTPETYPPEAETSTSETETSASETETSTTEPEASTEEEWPSAVEEEEDEEEKMSLYHNKVLGKLRIEVFVGPSRYKPGAFAIDETSFAQTVGSVKGPEFGVSILGQTSAEGASSLGAVYRQASYDGFKLRKAGLALQGAIRTPYVHPMMRVDVGYAGIFDGSIFGGTVENSPKHGFYTTFGFGIRVPIIRWLSFAGTFDWSLISLFGGGEGSGIAIGSQIGGTFALTVHLIGVDKN